MKHTLTKIKFISLSIFFGLIVVLAPFNSAKAVTYMAGDSNDVLVTIDLVNGSSYLVDDPFIVTGSIMPPAGVGTYHVDMSVIAGGIFSQLIPLNTLLDSYVYNTFPISGATDSSHIGLNIADFSTGVDSNLISQPNNSCGATLTFDGQFRWGRVVYNGPVNHPQLTVGVTEVGYVYPAPGNMYGEVPAFHNFIIPSNSVTNFFGGANCGTSRCEIEGTGGFDHAYVSSVTPDTLPGNQGRICVQSAPQIPPGCSYPNQNTCWQKPLGMQCSTFQSPDGPAEDC